MMDFSLYPYSSPIILTDALFEAYGGHTGTSTAAQRQSMYLLAEMKATENLGTFLLPTDFTGSVQEASTSKWITPFAYVNAIHWLKFWDREERNYYTITGTANWYLSVRNDKYGILDIDAILGSCQSCQPYSTPYKMELAANYGLSSGTSYQPNILMALTTYADILLNELMSYGNEAPGDIGIQQFQNQQYRETRIGLFWTTFGSSPRAIFANDLLKSYRAPRRVGL